jgi:hypothetical protein
MNEKKVLADRLLILATCDDYRISDGSAFSQSRHTILMNIFSVMVEMIYRDEYLKIQKEQ